MNLLIDLVLLMSSTICIAQPDEPYVNQCPDTGIIEVVEPALSIEPPASTVTLLNITLVPVVQPSFPYADLYLTDYPDLYLNSQIDVY